MAQGRGLVVTKEKYEPTDEHRAMLKPWADRWIANALDNRRIGDDWPSITDHVRGLYQSAGLKPPQKHMVIRVDGPVSGAFVSTIASAIWWLRDNPDRHRILFGVEVSDAVLKAAISVAIGLSLKAQPLNKTATNAATRAATRDAILAATRDATLAEISVATRDAIRAETPVATRAEISVATRATTRATTRDATLAEISVATYAAIRAEVSVATRAAIHDATRAAILAATRDATSDATLAAISDATRVATRAATRAETPVATRAATRAAISDATSDPTVAAVARFLVRVMPNWNLMWQGGSNWSPWSAYISFFRHIAKLGIDYSAWDDFEQLSQLSGARYMHEKFTIVCERHTEVHRDENGQPHCETGPAITWADGYSRYYWHGVNVPAEWIDDKDGVSPSLAISWKNIEQRRALCEILGWEKVLDSVDAQVIDEDRDPMVGTLIRCNLPDAPQSQFLRVRCGTGRNFCLPIPEDVTTAIGAQAWMWQVSEAQYRLLQVRT